MSETTKEVLTPEQKQAKRLKDKANADVRYERNLKLLQFAYQDFLVGEVSSLDMFGERTVEGETVNASIKFTLSDYKKFVEEGKFNQEFVDACVARNMVLKAVARVYVSKGERKRAILEAIKNDPELNAIWNEFSAKLDAFLADTKDLRTKMENSKTTVRKLKDGTEKNVPAGYKFMYYIYNLENLEEKDKEDLEKTEQERDELADTESGI
jgi:hypothetical protein